MNQRTVPVNGEPSCSPTPQPLAFNETVYGRWPQPEQALTLFIPKDSHESRFLSTFVTINRQINRNLGASRTQSQVYLNYAEAKP